MYDTRRSQTTSKKRWRPSGNRPIRFVLSGPADAVGSGQHCLPSAAGEWARSEFPAWATAPERAVRHFAEAYLCLWNHILDEDPQPWNAQMVDAARTWSDYLDV